MSSNDLTVTRRTFLAATTSVVGAVAVGLDSTVPLRAAPGSFPVILYPKGMVGTCRTVDAPSIIPGAAWYEAQAPKDGVTYEFPAGALSGALFLTANILAEGPDLAVFELVLQEGESGPAFTLAYAALPQAEARMRMRGEAVTQNRWQFPREGAWLKPMAGGARVDLARVDRMQVRILRKGDAPVRWCQTAITATVEEPPRLVTPHLPKGALLDAFGQSAIRDWSGKTRGEPELRQRLRGQLGQAPSQRWPAAFSPWGGFAARQLEGKRFFTTHHDGTRWWLVDPDGHPFWSAGLDCVRVDTAAHYEGLERGLTWLPEKTGPFADIYTEKAGNRPMVNYLTANLIRVFGEDWKIRWNTIAMAELRRLGFNTVGNWSDWKVASIARFPYVRPLDFEAATAPVVYRDFPDVFDPRFEQDAARAAQQLAATKTDPALIGYFLMNEPTWGFASETPAAGMLFNTRQCASRAALRDALAKKYATDAALSAAWGIPVTLAAVAAGEWRQRLTPAAERDLADFSRVMVMKLFGTLTDACRAVDPNHLNLGIRYYTVPPDWAVDGMRVFDVFSMNCYESRVPADKMAHIAEMLKMPVMVGEWHFGALDAGLPASGIGRVKTQADRGRAYRVYVEDAAAKPWCVGTHYFILYDESAIGRFDGECYNIGFSDVCNRPYEELCTAARASHERLYDVASGTAPPFADAPEYLDKLFL